MAAPGQLPVASTPDTPRGSRTSENGTETHENFQPSDRLRDRLQRGMAKCGQRQSCTLKSPTLNFLYFNGLDQLFVLKIILNKLTFVLVGISPKYNNTEWDDSPIGSRESESTSTSLPRTRPEGSLARYVENQMSPHQTPEVGEATSKRVAPQRAWMGFPRRPAWLSRSLQDRPFDRPGRRSH